MILHIPKDIIIDITEEFDLWFDSPVILHVFQCWVTVEHTTIPTTHLIVTQLSRILHAILFQDLCGFFPEIFVDKVWHFPVFFRDGMVRAFRFRYCLGSSLEFFCEGDIVEECPWIVEFMVPCTFEFAHRGEEIFQFLVANER